MKKLILCLIPLLLGASKAQDSTSLLPAKLNGNGRFSVFASDEKLIKDNEGYEQIYLKDHLSGELILISETDAVANRDCVSPSLSFDGRYVVFLSSATNLSENTSNVYLYDQALRTLMPLNLGKQFTFVTICGNGSTLALIAPERNKSALFIYHLASNLLIKTLESTTIDYLAINYYGTKITFSSSDTSLTKNTYYADSVNVFLFDVPGNRLSLISRSGDFGCLGKCYFSQISEQGVLFINSSSNLPAANLTFFSFLTNEIIPLPFNESLLTISLDLFGRSALIMNDTYDLFLYDIVQQRANIIPLISGVKEHPVISGDGSTMIYVFNKKYYHSRIDITAPAITYIGKTEIIVGTEYDPRQFIEVDGEKTGGFYILDDGGYDYQKIGEYVFSLAAFDNANNYTIYTFQIQVLPEQYPQYTGPLKIKTRINSSLYDIESKFTFVDDKGTPLTSYVIRNDVLFDKAGTYQIIIGAKNRFDRETQVSIEIKIVASIIGDFSLLTIPFVVLIVGLLIFLIKRYKGQHSSSVKEKGRLAPINQFWKI